MERVDPNNRLMKYLQDQGAFDDNQGLSSLSGEKVRERRKTSSYHRVL